FVHIQYVPRNLLQALVSCRTGRSENYIRFMEGDESSSSESTDNRSSSDEDSDGNHNALPSTLSEKLELCLTQ
ncbi:hypothetical protein ABVT39_009890, partial [Epinephelus coioides]